MPGTKGPVKKGRSFVFRREAHAEARPTQRGAKPTSRIDLDLSQLEFFYNNLRIPQPIDKTTKKRK